MYVLQTRSCSWTARWTPLWWDQWTKILRSRPRLPQMSWNRLASNLRPMLVYIKARYYTADATRQDGLVASSFSFTPPAIKNCFIASGKRLTSPTQHWRDDLNKWNRKKTCERKPNSVLNFVPCLVRCAVKRWWWDKLPHNCSSGSSQHL